MDAVMVRLALDLGIFKILAREKAPVHLESLHKEIGVVDKTLLQRILRTLGAMNAVDEGALHEYEANDFTMAFDTEKGTSGSKIAFEIATPAWNQIPSFLAETSYRNPSNSLDAPLQRAFNTKSHFFTLLQDRPGFLDLMSTFMTCHKKGRPEFPEIFPVETRLLDGCKDGKDAVVFVDVGGGLGQEVSTLRDMVPQITGRTVLQEQPELVRSFVGKDNVEVMEHDIFQPQPVSGARAYYFRNIFHDWGDEDCVKILEQTKPAMVPGYSKILINDLIVADQGAGLFMARSDIHMMALFNSMERSEKQWRDLLGRAGLSIIKIWTNDPRHESVIEAMLEAEPTRYPLSGIITFLSRERNF